MVPCFGFVGWPDKKTGLKALYKSDKALYKF